MKEENSQAQKSDFSYTLTSNSLIKITEELTSISDKIAIEDFTILKVIAHGTFGDILLIEHKEEGILYALKTLRKKDIIQAEQIRNVKSERR